MKTVLLACPALYQGEDAAHRKVELNVEWNKDLFIGKAQDLKHPGVLTETMSTGKSRTTKVHCVR